MKQGGHSNSLNEVIIFSLNEAAPAPSICNSISKAIRVKATLKSP